MGVARMLPRTELVVVTTPAVSAQKVAVRAVDMARKSYLRVAGVIENMSSFTCEHGTSYALFGEGGGAALAHDAGVPLLGQIPIEAAVAAGGDEGRPVVLGAGPAADAFRVDRRPHRRRSRPAAGDGRVLGPHRPNSGTSRDPGDPGRPRLVGRTTTTVDADATG